MPVNAKLLEILRCPVSQQPLSPLSNALLRALNDQVTTGEVLFVDGEPVSEPLTDALITDDHRVIYAVVDQLPMMLPDRGIGTVQLEGFDR